MKYRITGRRIVEFHLRPYSDGRGGLAYDPVLLLDDGSRLSFRVQETETEPGVLMIQTSKVEPKVEPKTIPPVRKRRVKVKP